MATAVLEQKLTSVSLMVKQAIYRWQILALEDRDYDQGFEKVRDGTHRFSIHPGQAIFVRPRGFFVNRAEARKRKLEENAAAVELWARRYAVRTPDGLEIRER